MEDSRIVRFRVVGSPKPKGSTVAMRHRYTGRIITMNACAGESDWAGVVYWDAVAARAYREVFRGAVKVRLDFYLRGARRPKPGVSTLWVNRRHDLDKLVRSVLDAMTGALWVDDSQVAEIVATKRYVRGDDPQAPGVLIAVGQME